MSSSFHRLLTAYVKAPVITAVPSLAMKAIPSLRGLSEELMFLAE
jgi:hypothetical protein